MRPDLLLLKIMLANPGLEWKAPELCIATGKPRRTIYYHLTILKNAGLVSEYMNSYIINPEITGILNEKKRIINRFRQNDKLEAS